MYWWIRRLIRKHYQPLPSIKEIQKRRKNIAMMYALMAWNMVGLAIYYVAKDSFPKESNAAEYAKMLGVKNATVVHYSGLSKVEEYDVEVDVDDSHTQVDIFSEAFGDDIKYFKYINEEEK